MYPVWWGSTIHIPQWNVWPPKMKTKIEKMFIRLLPWFLHIVELWCDFKIIVGPWSYIYNVHEFCWPIYTHLGRDTFAVAGTSNLIWDKIRSSFLFRIRRAIYSKKYEIAKTSLAHYNQIPLDQILEACIWSNHNTFTSFYLQNISEVNKKDFV